MNNLIGNKIYEKKKIFFLFALIIKANLCVYCFEEEEKIKILFIEILKVDKIDRIK